MLLDTHRPLTEIAYEVGFQDLSNFVRTYRCQPASAWHNEIETVDEGLPR